MKKTVLFGVLLAAGCGAADLEVDPKELELRDLLGLSPDVTREWGASQRQAAREVIEPALSSPQLAGAETSAPLGVGMPTADAVLESAAAVDEERLGRGLEPIALVRAELSRESAIFAAIATEPLKLASVKEPEALLSRMAERAGHPEGAPLETLEAPREPFAALYLAGEEPMLLYNPVLLHALEVELEAPEEPAATRSVSSSESRPRRRQGSPAAEPTGGNPYSFYGSVGECAAAGRIRCEECMARGNCTTETRDAESGDAECTALAAESGRGYSQLCVNLSLAIATVSQCVSDRVPGCPQVTDAGNRLATLDFNDVFLEDPMCAEGLDACLTELYGPPEDEFPDAGPFPDGGGGGGGGGTPRDTDVDCDQSCENENNTSCNFDPQCDSTCNAGSCDQVFACDADCSSDGSSGGGGGGGGDGCDSGCGGGDSGGGGGGGGGGGCDSGCGGDDSGGGGGGGGGSSCDSSCGGGDGGGDSGGSSGCSGGDDSGGGGSSGCGGGDSGGGCGGGDSGGSCSSSGGGDSSSGCRADGARARLRFGAALAVLWALFPIGFLAFIRRRGRRQQ